MMQQELVVKIHSGEDSKTQFKSDITNVDSLAAEIVAFSNVRGGTIYVGVDDNGQVSGIPKKETGRINQLISNAASQHIKSPIAVQTVNVSLDNGNIVILIHVPEGLDKPYFDKNGIIWLKNGADKRRINSKEELQRLFQSADLVHADEVPTQADIFKMDTAYFARFLTSYYQQNLPDDAEQLKNLLNNMGLALGNYLNLAGLMLFAKSPQFTKPAFISKAIHFPGNDISVENYLDSEDFEGKIEDQFKGAMAFVLRSLQKRQSGQGVNALGIPEIPKIVFEELIANALVHRDYFVSAPIRLFVYGDRIELISPGHLPNHLTIQKIEAGISNIRNPILASFAFKGILPYRGLGTGIRRALTDWPNISFVDDRDGNQFKVTVFRSHDSKTDNMTQKEVRIKPADLKTTVVSFLKNDPKASYEYLAKLQNVSASTIKRLIQELKNEGKIQRTGSKRGGAWKVLS
ncbi:MAG: putative DNA binding domain-containing protein [Desulfuromonadales bacterium]|nr:putative DNA binding domain-containing protein [Desulfuromonadales bacterium]